MGGQDDRSLGDRLEDLLATASTVWSALVVLLVVIATLAGLGVPVRMVL